MLSKWMSAAVMLFILALLPVSCILYAHSEKISFPGKEYGTISERFELFLSQSFPAARDLKSLRVNLRYRLGAREQDNVFISERRLIENITPPDGDVVRENTKALIEFASQRAGIPTYITLIPTASAILQNDTPEFADAIIYNQKQFIDRCYTNFVGKISYIDVYSILRQNSENYIYYNTDSLLTPLGGYYAYTMLARRMGNQPYNINQFNVQYLDYNYYGGLYDRIEYKNVRPDVISIYSYIGKKEFGIRQIGENRTRQYNTLYPLHMLEINRPLDIYMGGLSSQVEIVQKGSTRNALLVFGDRQMLSILPFLACSYPQISFFDLSAASVQQIRNIQYENYNNVLFAYSVDTFMHSNEISKLIFD